MKIFWIIAGSWLCAMVCIGLLVTEAWSETIMLQWDQLNGVDGYYIYQAVRAYNAESGQVEHQFDYENPIKTEKYPDGKIPATDTKLIVDLPGVENADTKYIFTARAFLDGESSSDSNTVAYVVCLVAPNPPINLTGHFDRSASSIKISWDQIPDEQIWRDVDHWIIYYRLQGVEDWTPIGRINKDHELSMIAPFNVVDPHDQKNVEFTIVAYRRSGVYSSNSATLVINVNRKEIPTVQNLWINIEIPVQK